MASPTSLRPATRSYVHVGQPLAAWHYGVFDCTRGNPRTCVMSFCCPCVQHGRNVAQVEQDPLRSTPACLLWMACCACVYSGPVRHRMRVRYGLVEAEGDTWTACCCPCCSVAQVAHELAVRGEPLAPRVHIVLGPVRESMDS